MVQQTITDGFVQEKMMFGLQLSTLTETGQLQADIEVKTLTARIIQPLLWKKQWFRDLVNHIVSDVLYTTVYIYAYIV